MDKGDGGNQGDKGILKDTYDLRDQQRNLALEDIYQMSLINPPAVSQQFGNLDIDWLDFFKTQDLTCDINNSVRVDQSSLDSANIVYFYPQGKQGGFRGQHKDGRHRLPAPRAGGIQESEADERYCGAGQRGHNCSHSRCRTRYGRIQGC